MEGGEQLRSLTIFGTTATKASQRIVVLSIVCNQEFFSEAQNFVLGTLFEKQPVDIFDPTMGEAGIVNELRAGKILLYENFRYDQPLERYERVLREASGLEKSGLLICFGDHPNIPESLRQNVQVIWYHWPDLMTAIRLIEIKFGELTVADRVLVESEIGPLIQSFDYSALRDAVNKAQSLLDLKKILSRGGNLPPQALVISDAWMDKMNHDEAWLATPFGLRTRLDTSLATVIAVKPGTRNDLELVIEVVSFWFNQAHSGHLATLDLNGLEESDCLNMASELNFWSRLVLSHYSTAHKMVILVKGVRNYRDAIRIKEKLLLQPNVSVILFEINDGVLGWGAEIPIVDLDGKDENISEDEEVEREKIEVRRGPDPVREMHEENFIKEEKMLNGTIISAISDKMKNAEHRQAWASLTFGAFLIIANFGFNVLGLLPAFLRPDPMVKLAEMMKTSNASTFILLMINLFVGSGIAWAIRHMEVTGLAHWNEGNFPKGKAIFGYCCGTLLNLIGFIIVGPMPDDVLSKVGFGVFLFFVAFAVDFFGDIMFEEAFETLFKKSKQTTVITQTEEQTETETETPYAQVHTDLFPVRGRKRCSFSGCGNLVEDGTMAARMFSRDGKTLVAVGCPQKHLDALERMSARNMNRTTFSHVYESASAPVKN